MQGGNQNVLYHEGGCDGANTQNKEYPPKLSARVVLGLDNDRMEESYYKKGANGDDDAREM